MRRLFERVDPEKGRVLMYTASQYLYNSLPDCYILDWDSTVTTRYGDQDGVRSAIPNKNRKWGKTLIP